MSKRIKPSLRELSPLLVGGLRVLDSLVVVLILYALVLMHIGQTDDHYEDLALLSFLFSLVIFHYAGLYQPWRGQHYLSELKAILTAWLTMACLVLFLLFVFHITKKYSRIVLINWFVITPIVLFLLRAAFRKILRLVRAQGKNMRSAVIVGAGDLGLSLARNIEEVSWSGIKILGFFDDCETTENFMCDKQTRVLGKISSLSGFLQRKRVDFIYIALPMRDEKKIYEILNTCRTHGARIYLVPDLDAFRFFNGRLERLGKVMLLDFNPDFKLKNLFDICFALLVILITLPLSLTIAMVIKLFDRGPVFYQHRRITVTGREFYCIKFRTMYVDADKRLEEILNNDAAARKEWKQTFKLKNDPRITLIGRFLRKTSLDELPQFVNVLRGEMSVVGARPIVQRELYDYYKENGGIYCSIKPGITGIWQVGQRSNTEDYQDRVKKDVWYALNHNFWLDLKIICLTLVCMIRRNGAY
jgi:putative colanic acid biosysnthesis UDP-glucose lipid carrier transferase